MNTHALLAALAFATWQAAAPPAQQPTVEIVKDVAYYTGKDADPVRHKLDVYLPKGQKEFPTLLWVHGGGWKNGKNDDFEFLGKTLAKHGIGVIAINYRLFPDVKFPTNIEDVARAVAWTHQHIGEYGGRADRLFLGGHSAGGHLVSLLAADGSYLKVHKLAPTDIRGVVSISGLYDIPRGRFPLFEDSDQAARKASPLHQIQGQMPPFLVVYADKDFPKFGDMAEEFVKALHKAKVDARILKVEERTHGNVATKIADDGDPVREAIVEFVRKYADAKGTPR